MPEMERAVSGFRERIQQAAHLNAFISLTDEPEVGPAVAVKDLIAVRGTVTTGGGTILPWAPDRQDAGVVRAVRDAGCFVIGKSNLHEWAFGVTSVNPHFGPVKNPVDPARIAGGSSGGSAAAVAASLCDWAIGTDTGGSIRIPAALCGVVGVKPSTGQIELDGVLPLSPTLDTVGPLARDVTTAAHALRIMGGDATAGSSAPPPATSPRLGVPEGWVTELDPDSRRCWDAVSRALPSIPFPDRAEIAEAGLTILFYEAARVHADRVRRYPDSYGGDVRQHLLRGLEIGEAEYRGALAAQRRFSHQAADAMAGLDALLCPATAIVAPLISEPGDVRTALTMYTRVFNVTGQPVVTLPGPTTGLPVGIQVIGHVGRDSDLLGVALALEQRWSKLSMSNARPSG